MLAGYSPVVQALFGTLFTWGLTAVGAACVIFLRGDHRKSLDAALGFAAGIMLAASFWSLLDPAIEIANSSNLYGNYSFGPVSVGFFLGALFVYACDKLISYMGINTNNMMMQMTPVTKIKDKEKSDTNAAAIDGTGCASENGTGTDTERSLNSFSDCVNMQHSRTGSRRRKTSNIDMDYPNDDNNTYTTDESNEKKNDAITQWKRIMLLVIAITVHNIPEGLAVGVNFGALGSSNASTLESARNLAIGIGIQNFPEGLAISLPLRASGYSLLRSFWYGQLSGIVEPIFGVLGAIAVTRVTLILPYALAFAAGAMVYIVANDIIPEASSSNNATLASWSTIIGFMIMMCLDVGLS